LFNFAHVLHGKFFSSSASALALAAFAAASSSAFFLAHLAQGVFPSFYFLAFSASAISFAFLSLQA
jgi:hypothetical protein